MGMDMSMDASRGMDESSVAMETSRSSEAPLPPPAALHTVSLVLIDLIKVRWGWECITRARLSRGERISLCEREGHVVGREILGTQSRIVTLPPTSLAAAAGRP